MPELYKEVHMSDTRTARIRLGVIQEARSHIGRATYNGRATLAEAPDVFNCFRFIQWIWRQADVELPEHMLESDSLETIDITAIRYADLLFVPRKNYALADDTFGHVGILTEMNTIIHATKWRDGVVEDPIKRFIERGFLGARRVPI